MNIIDILRYTRKHGSKTEAMFINNYLIPRINMMGYKPKMDEVGNLWVETSDKSSAPYLFVAHIDTCHQREGMINPVVEGSIVKMNPADVNHGCLGADDAVGIYANLRMMDAGVPGTYLFTRGEEKGGIGASYIGKQTPSKLEGFKLCVEVDRAGTDEVIVSQSYGDCASIEFAAELGDAIGMGHKPSSLGVYTDCSEFADVIPECVNLGAGYENQHTVKETVNLAYVEKLINRLIAVDWSSLNIYREPGDYGDADASWWQDPRTSNYYTNDIDEMEDYVASNPIKVAHYLAAIGVDVYEIEHEYDSLDGYDSDLGVGLW